MLVMMQGHLPEESVWVLMMMVVVVDDGGG